MNQVLYQTRSDQPIRDNFLNTGDTIRLDKMGGRSIGVFREMRFELYHLLQRDQPSFIALVL